MPVDQLSSTFAALADPTRRAILVRLAGGEATVNELAEPFSISLQAISKHLKVLERAGLISRSREKQWRPCRLEAAPLERASTWIDENRQIWTDRLGRLDQHLEDLQRQTKGTQS
jgi:DNA-binding transcriptional ArsR family regulator